MERARPELRPLAIGEIVDAAIKLYRSNFGVLIRISGAVMLPIGLVQLIATILVGPVDFASMVTVESEPATLGEALGPLGPIYTVVAITGTLAFLATIIVQGASIQAIATVYQGAEPDWRESLRIGLRRWLPLLAATLLTSIGAVFGLIFCLVPGVWLFTVWSVTPAPVVTERMGAISAMRRSYQLVKGRFWQVLGAMALGYLLYFVASQVLSTVTAVVTAVGTMGSGSVSFIPSTIGQIIVGIIATPFLAIITTIIYFDLRVRKEGYDLELMAADLAGMERPTPPPVSDDHPFGLGNPGGP